MKLKLLSILLAFFAFTFIAKSGNLTITPEKQQEGSIMSIQYSSDARFSEGEKLFCRFYTFKGFESLPVASEILLDFNASEKLYSGNYRLQDSVVFGLMLISNGNIEDNNHTNLWDFIVCSENGKPLLGAYLRAGISYLGNLPENCKRNVDFEKGLEFLDKEASLYPDNIQAQIGLTSLQFDLKKISKDEFQAQMKKLVNRNFDLNLESDVRAVSRALRAINETKGAEDLENRFAAQFPKSELAEEINISKLAETQSLRDFSDGIIGHLNKFPNSSSRERLFSALVSGYLQDNKIDEVLVQLEQMVNVPSSAFSQIAFALFENRDFSSDEEYLRTIAQAMGLINKAKEQAQANSNKFKPSYFTESEWNMDRQLNFGGLLEVEGELNMMKEDYTQALKKLDEAKKLLGEESTFSLYDKMVESAFKAGELTTAYSLAKEAILLSKTTEGIEDDFETLFDSLKVEGDEMKILDSLKTEAKKIRLARLKFDKLDKVVNFSTVKSIDGQVLNVNSLKNKVVVLDFWATWCGPCNESLPVFEKLYLKNSSNQNLVFAAVNVWENPIDREKEIKKYINNSNLDLPVYIDENDTLPLRLGITGLPTKIYIDKYGKIQFIEVGFTNESAMLRDSEDIIELLLSE